MSVPNPPRTFPTDVAFHEASHAAALMLAGLFPKGARIDRPTATLRGVVMTDWEEWGLDQRTGRKVLIAVLAGAMTEPQSSHSPNPWKQWPLDADALPSGASLDVECCQVIANYLGIDSSAEWDVHVDAANKLARTKRFRRLTITIANELDRIEVLDGDDLRRVMATVDLTDD